LGRVRRAKVLGVELDLDKLKKETESVEAEPIPPLESKEPELEATSPLRSEEVGGEKQDVLALESTFGIAIAVDVS